MIEAIYKEVLSPGDIAVDGGAPGFRHTFPMAQIVQSGGKVYAFEPNPEPAARMRERLEEAIANSIIHSAETICLIEAALSNSSGISNFHIVLDDIGFSGLRLRYLPAGISSETEIIRARTVTLDQQVPSEEDPVFIKLDLEGGEFRALQGAEKLLTRAGPIVVF